MLQRRAEELVRDASTSGGETDIRMLFFHLLLIGWLKNEYNACVACNRILEVNGVEPFPARPLRRVRGLEWGIFLMTIPSIHGIRFSCRQTLERFSVVYATDGAGKALLL